MYQITEANALLDDNNWSHETVYGKYGEETQDVWVGNDDVRYLIEEVCYQLRAAQQSVQADGLCPNCKQNYRENEVCESNEWSCECARR
jgi:hypothetical protein